MSQIIVTTRDGKSRPIKATLGISVMEIIRDSGIDELRAVCGGSCACGTCHVYVETDALEKLPAQSDVESEILGDSAHLTAASRLSCQIVFDETMEGMTVTVAPEG